MVAEGDMRTQRQHQDEARTDAPVGECLAHVVIARRQTQPVVGGIEQPDDADREIDDEPGEFYAAAQKFELAETADHAAGKRQVVRHVIDALDHFLRQDGSVDPRDRTHQIVHQDIVRCEHRAVERFDRIASGNVLGHLGRSPYPGRAGIVAMIAMIHGAGTQQQTAQQSSYYFIHLSDSPKGFKRF